MAKEFVEGIKIDVKPAGEGTDIPEAGSEKPKKDGILKKTVKFVNKVGPKVGRVLLKGVNLAAKTMVIIGTAKYVFGVDGLFLGRMDSLDSEGEEVLDATDIPEIEKIPFVESETVESTEE